MIAGPLTLTLKKNIPELEPRVHAQQDERHRLNDTEAPRTARCSESETNVAARFLLLAGSVAGAARQLRKGRRSLAEESPLSARGCGGLFAG